MAWKCFLYVLSSEELKGSFRLKKTWKWSTVFKGLGKGISKKKKLKKGLLSEENLKGSSEDGRTSKGILCRRSYPGPLKTVELSIFRRPGFFSSEVLKKTFFLLMNWNRLLFRSSVIRIYGNDFLFIEVLCQYVKALLSSEHREKATEDMEEVQKTWKGSSDFWRPGKRSLSLEDH